MMIIKDAFKSLFGSVLETAVLFENCDGYSQSKILVEECAELIVALSHFERNRMGSFDEILEELSHVLISCFAFIICANIPLDGIIAEVNKKYNKYHIDRSVNNDDFRD
jgi:NTP pyrophosphatase (non-canonical NTP hydrolase)